jgi:hypothetical protein
MPPDRVTSLNASALLLGDGFESALARQTAATVHHFDSCSGEKRAVTRARSAGD